MGRQVSVNLTDLLQAGLIVRIESELVDGLNEGDSPTRLYCAFIDHPDYRAWSTHAILSTDEKANQLWFDCRHIESSANGWIEQALIDLNIPYTAG